MLMGMVALLMLALGAAAGASTGQDGPTPPELGDPVAAHNDIWAVDATADFTLTFNGATTGTISADASPDDVEAALAGLAGVTDVRVRGTAGSYVVTIAAPLDGILTGAGATVTQTQTGTGPVTGQVSPHGAYSASTNFCLQCHDVHDAAGAYALMAEDSVTATCETCHGNYSASTPTGALPSGPGLGLEIGTVSIRTAYDTGSPGADHGSGSASIPDGGGGLYGSDWSFGWGFGGGPPAVDSDDVVPDGGTSGLSSAGLYCASCHTPHGEYGQMVNNWVGGEAIEYDWPVTGWDFAHVTANGTSWDLCTDDGTGGVDIDDNPLPGGPTTPCIPATIRDAEDQVVSLYGYKLLSAYPNHTYSDEQSYNTTKYNHDGAGWCTACHTANDLEGPNHNHETGCSACHGNPADDPGSADFPHTSSKAEFLIDYPDALCISCHTPGSLP